MADDERDVLLRRFLKVIGEPAGSTFFDEDELVELFDYAGDLGDDILRIEVLIWGARLHPDSTSLAERRATLYYDFGNETALPKVMKNVPQESVIRRLLMLRSSKPDAASVVLELESILSSVSDFKDEEIIQFVQAAGELGQYQWLKDNQKEIVKRCSFPQAFLYEMIPYAEESGDYNHIISVLEELTDLEPFNNEFWEMLADYYDLHFNDPEKTLNAADYALAIDPNSSKAAILKASSMHQLNYPFGEIEKLLLDTIGSHPDENSPVHLLADLYATVGRMPDAISLLMRYVESHPEDKLTLSYLISGTQGNLDPAYLKRFFDIEKPDCEKILEWARSAMQQSHPEVALQILTLLGPDDYSKNEECYYILLTALYSAGRYDEVREKFMDYKEQCENSRMLFNMNIAVLYALSSFAWAQTLDAKAEAIEMIEWMEAGAEKCALDSPCYSAQEAVSRFGVKEYLAKIKEMIKSGVSYNPESLNPFRKGVYGL